MTHADQYLQDKKISGVLDSRESREAIADLKSDISLIQADMVTVKDALLHTTEVLDMFETLKEGIKVLGWIGGAAKWVGSIIALFAGLYALVQNLRGVK